MNLYDNVNPKEKKTTIDKKLKFSAAGVYL